VTASENFGPSLPGTAFTVTERTPGAQIMGHVFRLQAAVIVFVVASGCGLTDTGQAEKKAAPPTADGGAKQPAPTTDDQAPTEKAPSRATLAERFEKVESEPAEIAAKVAALPDEARAEWSKTVGNLEADARAMKKASSAESVGERRLG
jgi:hypothetical protein